MEERPEVVLETEQGKHSQSLSLGPEVLRFPSQILCLSTKPIFLPKTKCVSRAFEVSNPSHQIEAKNKQGKKKEYTEMWLCSSCP